MNLNKLLVPYIRTSTERSEQIDLPIPSVHIEGLVTDNRDVNPGDCFIALAGITQHGKIFIDDAIARGATAILLEVAEEDIAGVNENLNISYRAGVPVIAVNNLKAIVNKILIDFYQLSSSAFNMRLMAVTGTNGKSSITRFAAQMSHGLQQPTGLMGTLGFGVWPNITASKNTTPELAALLYVCILPGAALMCLIESIISVKENCFSTANKLIAANTFARLKSPTILILKLASPHGVVITASIASLRIVQSTTRTSAAAEKP